MSEPDSSSAKRGRLAATVVLTGLVAGAALGPVTTEHGKSIRDQIAESFTPGTHDAGTDGATIVIMND
jgi:hypothetical protein